MKWQHFRALIWLRGRLFRNRMRKAGKLNAILTQILQVIAVIASVSLFFAALGLGIWFLPKFKPDHVLYLWTGIVVAFLFFWLMGVMTELQRSEVLSIEKLFHFPISPSSAFVINYLSSLVCLSLILFLPAMVGLAIGSVIALGPWMLVSLPLLFAFVLMVTTVTYQFRGWLATLMVNKRRRRTIVACLTGVIILISQAPNWLNLAFQGRRHKEENVARQAEREELGRLLEDLKSKKITEQQFAQLQQETTDARHAKEVKEDEELLRQLKHWVSVADLALPPGWMAYGAYGAAEHNVWPAVLGTILLCAIGAASLNRSYNATLRFYLGAYRTDQNPPMPSGTAAVVPALANQRVATVPAVASTKALRTGLVGRSIPWVPERAAATGLATLRSLLRAPEVKMMLLTPIILGVVMMTTRLAGRGNTPIPAALRPPIALGIVVTVVVSLSQLFHNQFGFDRNAFRAYVLSPAPRWQILLGKNLALFPFVGTAGLLFLAILEYLFPLRVTDLLATCVEMVTAYLIVCLAGNQMSIVLPSAVRQGSMRSSDTKLLRGLARFAGMLAMMFAFVPLAVPLGVDYLAQQFAWADWIPIYLLLSLLLVVATIFVYRIVLDYQGGLLQRRELRILEAVTTKDD